jgi:hypothetical protein
VHIKTHKYQHIYIVFAILLILSLTSCGPANTNATPTLSVDAIFTAAFQTLSAQQATQLALTPPTDTPSPTPFATVPPPPTQSGGFLFGSPTSSTSGIVQGCNNAAFVKDVTIPDGTIITPGKTFVKTWQIQNNGTCAWSTSFQFSFISGDQMGGTSVAIPNSVPSGQQVQLSVTLTAPTTIGNYKGYWRMQDDQGKYFGDSPWVSISVSGSAVTDTPTGATNTAAPETNTPTNTPVPPTETPEPTAT